MNPQPLTSALAAAGGRFLLLPEQAADLPTHAQAAPVRVRRYRLTRLSARPVRFSPDPTARSRGDFAHLRETYD